MSASLCLYKSYNAVFLTVCISCATLLWLSGRKTASACQREVSLVLSISSGVDKKNRWDRGGQRAMLRLTGLFIWPVSDILPPPPTPHLQALQ